MTALYVTEQGATIGRRGERLVIEKGGHILEEVPLGQIDQLIIMGNVQMTTQATHTLVQNDIDVVYLSSRGTFRFRPEAGVSPHIQLRQAQMRRFDDMAFRLRLAQAIIDGKINNQRTILQRQLGRLDLRPGRSTQPIDPALFERSLAGMQNMQHAAQEARTLESLRGYEGKAAAYYFEAVRSLIAPAWGFKQRDYYPPPDPFNALLSFAYTLVHKDSLTAVRLIGLDPYLGFFHEVHAGRPALAIDLMEEWRPVVADALVLELVNRGTLQPDRFVRTNNTRRPVELGPESVQTVIQNYETRLANRHLHFMAGPGTGGRATLRHCMELQARQVAQMILGQRDTFEPFRVR